MESQDKPIDSLNKSTVKPENKCKHVPIIITLSILLVASLGFGGYEFWQNSRQKDEIDSLQTEKNKAEESKTTEEKPSPKETEEEPSTEKKDDTANYIYLNEWGIKIKKPTDVASLDYLFDGYRLYLWGTEYHQGDQAVGDGALFDNNGTLNPYLAKIYSDVRTGKNLSTGETVGSRDELCSVQNGTQILNADDLDLGVRNEDFTWHQALCYKENDNLSNYYQNMSNYVQPTLEKLKAHFLNEENYVRL